jgi:hypothetical protein
MQLLQWSADGRALADDQDVEIDTEIQYQDVLWNAP